VDVQRPLGNTLIDGELVVDVEPHTGEVRKTVEWPEEHDLITISLGQESLRLLAFDCLVVDKENIMGKNLDKRYGVGDIFYIVQIHCLISFLFIPSGCSIS
jgi:mRNA guanylyltransferase